MKSRGLNRHKQKQLDATVRKQDVLIYKNHARKDDFRKEKEPKGRRIEQIVTNEAKASNS